MLNISQTWNERGEPTDAELYKWGRDLLESGAIPDAIAVLRASLELSIHFKTLELIGECYIVNGECRNAVLPLAAATTLNPAQGRAPMLLARAMLALAEYNKATQFANIALERNPGYKEALRVLEEIATAEDAGSRTDELSP